MDFVKKLFGVMMLAVAAWMLARAVPDRVALLLWAVPALTLGWLLWFELRTRSAAVWALRVAGLAAGLYGVALAAGSAIAVVLALLGGRAISAQDKYMVQVPDGLAFSEFRGFEDWATVAVSTWFALYALYRLITDES